MLERYKFEFNLLNQLSTQKLYGMASFNFRKIDEALGTAIAEKKDSVYDLFHMQCRYYQLLERLKATEEEDL